MTKEDMTRHGGEHKGGKKTGYETDGTNIWIAPIHTGSFGIIQDQERAIEKIAKAYSDALALQMQAIETAYRQWWDAVYDDLGLDPTIVYGFNRIQGCLSPVDKTFDKEAPEVAAQREEGA